MEKKKGIFSWLKPKLEPLEVYMLAAENPVGKRQLRPIFRRRRSRVVLTREQVVAIKRGRRVLRKDMKERGLKRWSDFDETATSLGLYFDRRGLALIIPWFLGEKDESVVMISLDNKRKVLNTTRIFEGSVNSAQFNVRLAVQQALRDNATQIVLAHNHPNGFCFPSNADVSTTEYLVEVLKPLDIRIVDHLIISEGDCLCMSLLEETKHIFLQPMPKLPKVAD